MDFTFDLCNFESFVFTNVRRLLPDVISYIIFFQNFMNFTCDFLDQHRIILFHINNGDQVNIFFSSVSWIIISPRPFSFDYYYML